MQCPTVLVVEDDRLTRMLEVEAFRQEGFEVIGASNGYTALRLAGQVRLDAVVLDLALPEVSGLDVLVGLRRIHGAGLPVIVVSGATRLVDQLDPARVAAIIRKPFDLPGLIQSVGVAIASSRESRRHHGLAHMGRRRSARPLHPLVTGMSPTAERVASVPDPLTGDPGHDDALTGPDQRRPDIPAPPSERPRPVAFGASRS